MPLSKQLAGPYTCEGELPFAGQLTSRELPLRLASSGCSSPASAGSLLASLAVASWVTPLWELAHRHDKPGQHMSFTDARMHETKRQQLATGIVKETLTMIPSTASSFEIMGSCASS